MNKSKLLTAAFATAALSFSGSQALDYGSMEKCKIIDSNGRGLIKAHRTDCASRNHSCSGTNEAGDPKAWILVPTGMCAKINKGDLRDVPDEIKDKIEIDKLKKKARN